VLFTKRRILLIQDGSRFNEILVMKNLFDAQSEGPTGPEGERQDWIELAHLDGVDGLPGHIDGAGQTGAEYPSRLAF